MLPNLSKVVARFAQELDLIQVTQQVIDHKPVDVENIVPISATVQVANAEQISNANVDFSKRYLQIHTAAELKNTDRLEYKGVKYKAFLVNNYSDYGYNEAYFEELKSA